MLPGADRHTARFVAERLRRTLEEHHFACWNESFRITSSFGSAAYDPDISSPHTTTEELIRIADQNLYQAKIRGRNRVVCPDEAPWALSPDPFLPLGKAVAGKRLLGAPVLRTLPVDNLYLAGLFIDEQLIRF